MPRLPLLATLLLAGCTINTGVETTPTFQAARFVPPPPQPKRLDAQAPTPLRPAGRNLTGLPAVTAANRFATVEPSSSDMNGATWVIDAHDEALIYRVPVALQRATTLLLPDGEKFNSAVGGNVDGFLVSASYAGPRPAISILPREPGARGNLQLATTGGFYSFDLLTTRATAINLVDVKHRTERSVTGNGTFSDVPQPQGDFTRLKLTSAKGPLPAWAPAEAWADSYKMVVRFNGPLPVAPGLFAGQKGEQLVSYRTVLDQGSPIFVTNRRITEAELRLDQEVIRITVDDGTPQSPGATAEAGPARVGDWKQADNLPEPTSTPAVNVMVLPASPDGVYPAAMGFFPDDDLPPELREHYQKPPSPVIGGRIL